MSAYRLTIIGSALAGNKGAAAMLESAVQTLSERLGEVEFTLLSMYPREDGTESISQSRYHRRRSQTVGRHDQLARARLSAGPALATAPAVAFAEHPCAHQLSTPARPGRHHLHRRS